MKDPEKLKSEFCQPRACWTYCGGTMCESMVLAGQQQGYPLCALVVNAWSSAASQKARQLYIVVSSQLNQLKGILVFLSMWSPACVWPIIFMCWVFFMWLVATFLVCGEAWPYLVWAWVTASHICSCQVDSYLFKYYGFPNPRLYAWAYNLAHVQWAPSWASLNMSGRGIRAGVLYMLSMSEVRPL